jgi:hypothetical protein
VSTLASLVATYADSRGLGPMSDRDGIQILPVSERDDRHRLSASVLRTAPADHYVVVDVRSEQRVLADQWSLALSSCNVWNARMRLPKAWLDTDLALREAGVVLEGCVPLSSITQDRFDALADGVIVGSRQFWHWVDLHAAW